MSGAFLAGLPGQLKTLLDRLTVTRAAKLDNIDAALSTLAAASTALDDTVWTPARAAKIDALNAALSTRALQADAVSTANYTSTRAAYLDTLNTNADAKVSEAGGLLYPGSNGAGGEGSVTSSSWTTVYSYTGSGALIFLKMIGQGKDDNSSTTCHFRVVIDGNNAWGDTFATSARNLPQETVPLSFATWSGVLPFNSSISLQAKDTDGSAIATIVYGVMKT